MKRALFLLICVLMSCLVTGQNIYVHTTDGATHTYPLIDVTSITFDDNVMNLNLVTLDTVSWNISVITYYEYDKWYVSVPEGLVFDEDGVQVFPNPTQGELNLRYTLTSDTDLRVAIYNLNGLLVQEVYSGRQFAGEQQLQWDSSDANLTSGVYVCSVESKNSRFNKLIVINR